MVVNPYTGKARVAYYVTYYLTAFVLIGLPIAVIVLFFYFLNKH